MTHATKTKDVILPAAPTFSAFWKEFIMKPAVLCALMFLPASAFACPDVRPDPLDGFSVQDAMQYLDLPDPETVRVTATLENALIAPLIAQEAAFVTKTWCQIGIQRFIVDFEVPVEDDAIAAMRTRAVYIWEPSGDPVGWRIDQLGTRPVCARGDDPYAPLCP